MKKLLGLAAPNFRLADHRGVFHTLADAKGKWLLLYFYPKDHTPGCTVEACAFRDAWVDLKTFGVAVFGVSADSIERHHSFVKKYALPFPLLADPEKRCIRAFGVWGKKRFLGREYMGIHRRSFLISPKGRVVKVYDKVKPPLHATEVLTDVRALSANQRS